jgi:Mg2+ and Co2+ transporter CorA
MKRAHRAAHLALWFLITLVLLTILLFAWSKTGTQP